MTATSGIFYTVPQKYNQPPENTHLPTEQHSRLMHAEAGQGHDDLQNHTSHSSWSTPNTSYWILAEFGGQSCSLTLNFKINFFFFPKAQSLQPNELSSEFLDQSIL